MDKKRSNNLLGSILLVITAAVWGLAFSFQEMAATVPPFTLVALRSLAATLFLIPVILLFDRLNGGKRRLFSRRNGRFLFDISRKEWRGGCITGALLLLASVLQQSGIGETGAGKSGFITSLYMVIVPLLGLFLHRRVGGKNWIAVIIAVAGFYLISFSDGGFSMPAISDLMILACALVFAMQILSVDLLSGDCDGIRYSFVQFLTCTVGAIPISLFYEKPAVEAGGASLTEIVLSAILPILYLGIMSSGVAYTLQIIGQQKMTNPTVASILMSLENIFSAIFAAFLFPERQMSPWEILGCAAVFSAVILTQLPIGKSGDPH